MLTFRGVPFVWSCRYFNFSDVNPGSKVHDVCILAYGITSCFTGFQALCMQHERLIVRMCVFLLDDKRA